MRDVTKRLLDIHQAIANIESSTDKGRQVFDEDEKIQVWVIYHLMVLVKLYEVYPNNLKITIPMSHGEKLVV